MSESASTTADDPEAWARAAEQKLLDAALPQVEALGWTSRLVRAAAKGAGMSEAEAELLLPAGAADLVTLFSDRIDDRAFALLAEVDPASLKIRERIARGVEAKVEAAMESHDLVRREMGYLSLPQNLALGARLAWKTADRIWRWAGDTATDENHYSKRAILATLLGTTLTMAIVSGRDAASEHLARGIDGVMAYEKFKAKFKDNRWAEEMAEALGKMRYGKAGS